MSDVTETLQDLLERRLRELGQRRGRGESLSLREAWRRLPEDEHGGRTPTYETFRRIRQDGHTNIGDETVAALATMLDVDDAEVRRAAGQKPRLGRFELPSRADALNPKERAAVLDVVDAILDAASVREEPIQLETRRRRPRERDFEFVDDAAATSLEEE